MVPKESSLISKRFAESMNIEIKKATQGAVQADSESPLAIVGEVSDVSLTRGPQVFILDALVTEREFGDIIAGEPFLAKNDIAVRPSKNEHFTVSVVTIGAYDVIPRTIETTCKTFPHIPAHFLSHLFTRVGVL